MYNVFINKVCKVASIAPFPIIHFFRKLATQQFFWSNVNMLHWRFGVICCKRI
jgi:hypothetical protein